MFDPIKDSLDIKEAITKPKNMNSIIKIVAHRSNEQRQEILRAYFNKYQRRLTDDLRIELSGNFREAVIALFFSPIDYDCYQLYSAMKGLGTNEDTLIEILATRSNQRINLIKQRYPELYKNRSLIDDVKSDTSGFFRVILLKLLEANRANNPYPDEQDCNNCAKALYDASKLKKINYKKHMFICLHKNQEKN